MTKSSKDWMLVAGLVAVVFFWAAWIHRSWPFKQPPAPKAHPLEVTLDASVPPPAVILTVESAEALGDYLDALMLQHPEEWVTFRITARRPKSGKIEIDTLAVTTDLPRDSWTIIDELELTPNNGGVSIPCEEDGVLKRDNKSGEIFVCK